MKILAKFSPILGVLLLLFAVFFAQKESLQANQRDVSFVKAIR